MVYLYSGDNLLSLRCSDIDLLCQNNDADEKTNKESKYERKQELHQTALKSIKPNSFSFERDDAQTINKQRSEMLFDSRHKEASAIKRHRLKTYVRSMVSFMDKGQQNYWRQLFSQVLLAEIYEYNFCRALNRKQLIKDKEQELQYYVDQLRYIDSFNDESSTQPQTVWQNNASLALIGEASLQGHTLVWLNDTKDAFEKAPNVATLSWLDEFNWYRLYWVWAGGSGGFLASILDLDPINRLPGHDLASNRLESPGKFCGIASWAGYGSRLSLHSVLMAKHTIWHPWLSEEEKDVSWWTRFLAQADQRKHRMLNDIAWGYVNYASMYWYTGSISPYLGALGGMINVLLMIFDLFMAHLKLIEKGARYNKAKVAIEDKIANLQKQPMTESSKRLLFALHDELRILEINWKYEQQELKFVRLSAFLFTPAMTLIFAPIFPIFFPFLAMSAALISQLVFIGCLMSVVLTAWETYHFAQLEIDKYSELLQGAYVKLAKIQRAHSECSDKAVALTDEQKNQLRLYHLEHKRLMLECETMKSEQSHIRDKMLHSVLIQSLFPLVVLGSLFLPTIPALLCIMSAIIIAVLSKVWIDSHAPKAQDEFSNQLKDGEGICLTQEENETPVNSLFFLPGYSPAELAAGKDNINTASLAEGASHNSVALDKYGLFTTSYDYVEDHATVSLHL